MKLTNKFKQGSKVKWLTIEEVIYQIQNGFSFKSNKFKKHGKPIIRGQNIQEGKIIEDNLVYFDESDYPSDLKNYVDSGDIVITRWGTIGKIGFHFGQERLFFNQNICKLIFNNEIVKGKYLYYLLLSKSYQIKQCISGAALPIFDIEKFKKIKIPVPPLQEQEKIVNLLDKFSELSKELEKELNLRKKQYEYYRDELLSFKQDNKIKWLNLEKIATELYRGAGIKKEEETEGVGHPCVRYGWIHTSNLIYFDKCPFGVDENLLKTKKYATEGDLLFVITSENIEDIEKTCAYIGKEPILVGGDIVIMKHNQNPKYLSYVLSTTNALLQKTKGKVKSKVVHSNAEKIKKIMVPMPSLKKQKEIVDLLDKFWSLSNNIKEGLPAEILFRKQQYEYYRDELLKFKA